MGVLAENETGKKPWNRRWIFSDFVRNGVRAALVLSITIFAVYLTGSIPDPGLSDFMLFLFLRLLRYVALVLCAFSLFALGYSVHRLVLSPTFRNILGLMFYFSTGMLGAFLAMLDTFIVVATGGNA
jgi:hypothetical protein